MLVNNGATMLYKPLSFPALYALCVQYPYIYYGILWKNKFKNQSYTIFGSNIGQKAMSNFNVGLAVIVAKQHQALV